MSIKLTKAQTKSLASGVRRPKYKPREVRTVHDFAKNNHEKWRTCTNCGQESDARKSNTCDNCGERLV